MNQIIQKNQSIKCTYKSDNAMIRLNRKYQNSQCTVKETSDQVQHIMRRTTTKDYSILRNICTFSQEYHKEFLSARQYSRLNKK